MWQDARTVKILAVALVGAVLAGGLAMVTAIRGFDGARDRQLAVAFAVGDLRSQVDARIAAAGQGSPGAGDASLVTRTLDWLSEVSGEEPDRDGLTLATDELLRGASATGGVDERDRRLVRSERQAIDRVHRRAVRADLDAARTRVWVTLAVWVAVLAALAATIAVIVRRPA